MKNDKLISVKLDGEQYRHLARTVHYLSIERDTELCLSDLVREAIDNTYPMPSNKKQNEKQKD
jgi:hypothetical protein